MSGQEIVVAHPKTREVITLNTATDAQLAALKVACEEVALDLVKANDLLGEEVLGRMDRSAEWTKHVRIGDETFTFTAPSPNAGTTAYDAELLEIALDELVDTGTIDADTAEKALVREVTVTLRVPWGDDLEAAVESARDLVGAVKAEPKVRVDLPTINRMKKLDAVVGAIQVASKTVEQGARKVKFAVKPT